MSKSKHQAYVIGLLLRSSFYSHPDSAIPWRTFNLICPGFISGPGRSAYHVPITMRERRPWTEVA